MRRAGLLLRPGARTHARGMCGQKRAPVSWTSLGLMGAAGVGLLGAYQWQKEAQTGRVLGEVRTVGRPALGGPFVLVDHAGRPLTDAAYRGRFALLYFGFTYCPDICPNELVKIGKIVDRCASQHNLALKPVFISVDPGRDTVAQLDYYRADFHPSLDFLTGTTEQVAAAARAFRVYFSKVDEEQTDYLVDHSIVLYLLSPEGDFLDFFTQRAQVDDIVQRIATHAKAAKPAG